MPSSKVVTSSLQLSATIPVSDASYCSCSEAWSLARLAAKFILTLGEAPPPFAGAALAGGDAVARAAAAPLFGDAPRAVTGLAPEWCARGWDAGLAVLGPLTRRPVDTEAEDVLDAPGLSALGTGSAG